MTTFLFLGVALVICIWLFLYLDKSHRRQDAAYKAQQAEQHEQSETDYERPNVYYSKDIQIVSEPNYLTPPYLYSDAQRMTVELLQDFTVLFCCLIDGNLLSIQVKDVTLYSLIECCEKEILDNPPSSKHRTKPIDIITDYLFGVKIFKH